MVNILHTCRCLERLLSSSQCIFQYIVYIFIAFIKTPFAFVNNLLKIAKPLSLRANRIWTTFSQAVRYSEEFDQTYYINVDIWRYAGTVLKRLNPEKCSFADLVSF